MQNKKIKVWLPAVRTGSGTDVFTERLAEALRKRGLIVEVSWFSILFEIAPFLLKRVPAPAGTQVVIANSWNAFAFKRGGVALLAIVHHSEFDPNSKKYHSFAQRLYHRFLIKPYERLSFKAASVVVAVSRYAADTLKRYSKVDCDVRVIYNWIDIDRFSPLPHTAAEQDEKFRLLFVGSFIRRKGADLLAPLMKVLGNSFILRATAKNLADVDLPANFQPIGWVDQKALIREYHHCDALIFPSRSEGFPYAVLEAMACGKPVITCNSTSLPEAVTDGVNGLICPVDDVDALADACRRLAGDRELLESMGVEARRRVATDFSEEAALREYLNLIESLTAETQQPGAGKSS